MIPKKVLFLLPYSLNHAPSQRFRVEAYLKLVKQEGIDVDTVPFLDEKSRNFLYKKGSLFQKLIVVLKGFTSRLITTLFKVYKYDYLFIHREASPLGPPIFEWVFVKIMRKKIIYDFDDAIWLPTVSSNNKLALSLKAFWKVKYICKWSYKVSVGNHFLGNWAKIYNSNIIYNPTCVDMVKRYNCMKDQGNGPVTIGWTGSNSTLKYLNLVLPVIEDLEKEYQFEFIVICDIQPEWELRSLKFIPWKEENEIKDLLKINIGIMPLEQDQWSEGKCGFKVIQYLALGIPAVATPVGVNKQIVQDGENGFLCETAADWKAALAKLLQNASLRESMGRAGREKMLREFSTQSNESNFLSLFS